MYKNKAFSMMLSAILATTLMIGLMPSQIVSAEEYNIDAVFTDDNLISWIKENVDKDHNGKLDQTEIEAVTTIDIKNKKIKSVAGLSIFKNLEELDCSNNELTSIHANAMTSLKKLHCSGNSLTELRIDKLTNLESLGCSYNKLTKLDVSSNTALHYLYCIDNQITDLNISNVTYLMELDCSYNKLTSLEIPRCALLRLTCDGNKLTSLDVKEPPFLCYLSCSNNKLTELDVSDHSTLYDIKCNRNDIRILKTDKCKNLSSLECVGNLITDLDLSENPQIQNLDCRINEIKVLDISNNPFLLKAYEGGNTNKVIQFYSCEREEYPFPSDLHYCILSCDKEVSIFPSKTSENPKADPETQSQTPDTPKSDEPASTGITDTQSNAGCSFEDFVERLYSVALGRASETDGKTYWCNVVGNGSYSGADCARFFLTSPEFNGRNLSNEEYLKVLYKTFFDRDVSGDPDGFNFWLGKIDEWGRARVLEGFIDSTEWCNICATYGVRSGAATAEATKASQNATAFATRLYTECLGREPETDGLVFWSLSLTNQERTGTQAAQEFFYSKEFISKGSSDDEYITRLYKTFMGREPDDEGKAHWLNLLGKGEMNRDEIFNFFATCDEFTCICNNYAIAR